jgi:hypothetical protein
MEIAILRNNYYNKGKFSLTTSSMLGNLEKSQVTPSNSNSNSNLDEPTKLAFYLFNCAKTFLSSGSIQVLPAIKCLYMALSMVLAPQIEVELRLMLGNVLLDHTMNYNEALDQIQKAHQLAESVRFSDY